MKSAILGAGVAAVLVASVPVSAQVAVRDREDVIIRDHEHVWKRHRSWYRDRAECRTVRIRTRLPDGQVIIKTKHSC